MAFTYFYESFRVLGPHFLRHISYIIIMGPVAKERSTVFYQVFNSQISVVGNDCQPSSCMLLLELLVHAFRHFLLAARLRILSILESSPADSQTESHVKPRIYKPPVWWYPEHITFKREVANAPLLSSVFFPFLHSHVQLPHFHLCEQKFLPMSNSWIVEPIFGGKHLTNLDLANRTVNLV